MRRFDRENLAALDFEGIRRWENRYNAGGVCATLTLGTACGYAILVSRDPFAELACISVTLATMVSLVGRNYGSARAVVIMSLSACGPIIIGLLGLMDWFMALLAVLIVPFILTTWAMAARRARNPAQECIGSTRNLDHRRPFRPRPQQHAAWPVHARCRQSHSGRQPQGLRTSQSR